MVKIHMKQSWKNAQMAGPNMSSSVFEHHQLFAWSISLPSWKSIKRNKKIQPIMLRHKQLNSAVILKSDLYTSPWHQKIFHMGSVCHWWRWWNPDMTPSPKWPGKVTGGGSGLLQFSHMAQVWLTPPCWVTRNRHAAPARLLGHGQKDIYSPGLQLSAAASLLCLKPTHQM